MSDIRDDPQNGTEKGIGAHLGLQGLAPPQPGSISQLLASGQHGSTLTTQAGRVTSSDWMPFTSTMGTVCVLGPCGWRLGPLTGYPRAALARWSMAAPVRASGASTGSSGPARTAPITPCASSAHQVSLCGPPLPASGHGTSGYHTYTGPDSLVITSQCHESPNLPVLFFWVLFVHSTSLGTCAHVVKTTDSGAGLLGPSLGRKLYSLVPGPQVPHT